MIPIIFKALGSSSLLPIFSFLAVASSKDVAYSSTFSDPALGFPDLEVLRIEVLEDEDVVYLSSRAEPSGQCDNDCATYSAWTWSAEETEELKDEQSEE